MDCIKYPAENKVKNEIFCCFFQNLIPLFSVFLPWPGFLIWRSYLYLFNFKLLEIGVLKMIKDVIIHIPTQLDEYLCSHHWCNVECDFCSLEIDTMWAFDMRPNVFKSFVQSHKENYWLNGSDCKICIIHLT